VTVAVLSAAAAGGFGPPSDDRMHVDAALGLFVIADASGPTYPGHHVPLGVDRGLEMLAERYATATGAALSRMRVALDDAHQLMLAMAEAYAQRMDAPPAHFSASITAVAIEGAALALVQVGSARAYRWRDGELELLAPDHTLATMLAAVDPERARAHRRVVVSVLGITPQLRVATRTVDVRDGDVIVLCTDGVWMSEDGDASVRALAQADDEARVRAIVDAAAERTQDDASAIVLRVSTAEL
jgi:protein phosphatase